MNKKPPHKYIFCYLDVLGYKSLVQKNCQNIELIQLLETSFEQVFFNHLKSMRNRPNVRQHELKEIFDRIQVYVISDTILIRMSLNDLKILSHNQGEGYNKAVYVQMFCNYIMFIFFMFPSKVGYFLRGGISINEHYESTFGDKGMFIFSRALIDSYNLELKADVIRLLIHDNIISYIEEFGGSNEKELFMKDYLYKDYFGDNCLNIYKQFEVEDIDTNEPLSNMKDVLSHQFKKNKDNDKILTKYKYFIQLHNTVMIERLNKPEYVVDIEKL